MKKFKPTIHPFNRPLQVNGEAKDLIVIGGSCVNTFRLDFDYLKYVESNADEDASDEEYVDKSLAKVIYRQGFRVVLEKIPEEFIINRLKHTSYLTVVLSPDETKLFNHNYLDTTVQIMIINKAGNMLYDIPEKLRVVTPKDYIEDTTIESLNR